MLRQLYNNWICYQDGIQAKKRMNMLTKELFRKAIHICAAFVPLFLDFAYYPVMVLLTLVLVLYCVAEYLRCKGHTVPVISFVTMVAARKRDENRFVLGPATLAMGVLLTAAFFQPLPARVGICALAFGDGLASLVGKCFGQIRIPFTGGKTVAGSLACFAAIFCSTYHITGSSSVALGCGLVGIGFELLPLKDLDNLVIPILIAGICQFYFHT